MNNAATVDGDPREKPVTERWSRLRRLGRGFRQAGRTILPYYVAALLLVCSVQAVCIFLLWRPPQDWVSFATRFATSPAIAGLFALGAAIIGTNAVRAQLAHTKEKAADEAWWQQFEWVTDRIITSSKADEEAVRLPSSLAFDLMNSLSRSARAPFQKDAVDGIVDHYLKGFREKSESPAEQGETIASETRGMDEAGAKSLRNLIDTLPETSASSRTARAVLQAYEYEQEVLKALEHRGFDLRIPAGGTARPDAFLTFGTEEVVVEAKRSIEYQGVLEQIGNQVRRMMTKANISRGVIVTPPTKYNEPQSWGEGIYLVQWEPRMGSDELSRQIKAVLNTPPT